MIFHENRLLMKYHTLFFSKIKKDVIELSSAAVVICTLKVNPMFGCVKISFPPTVYLLIRVDIHKSCILNGGILSCSFKS